MSVGVVVIGRNEGARLERCLAGLLRMGVPIVYADSGSSDGSAPHARACGVGVVELDASRPFSAARGRNEGFQALLAAAPDVDFVQFVDGDCELEPGWLERAAESLAQHEQRVLVCGTLRERAPARSVYNRLCQLEWDEPAGPIDSCGGLFMVRREAFERLGGFDTSLVSSEEPELCGRLAAAGGELFRLDAPMASHDAGMERLAQWWTRQRRCGYGDLDTALRFGQNQDRVASVWIWSVGWLVASLLALTIASAQAGASVTLGVLAAALALPVVQALRIAQGSRAEGRDAGDARLLGVFTMLAKWPRLQGQLHYLLDRLRGGPLRLVEYRRLSSPRHPGG